MKKIIMKEMDIGKLKPARYNPRKNLQPGNAEYEAPKKSIERWDLVAQEDRYYWVISWFRSTLFCYERSLRKKTRTRGYK